jgi:hypothetical protein
MKKRETWPQEIHAEALVQIICIIKKVWAKKNQRFSKNIGTNLEVLPMDWRK